MVDKRIAACLAEIACVANLAARGVHVDKRPIHVIHGNGTAYGGDLNVTVFYFAQGYWSAQCSDVDVRIVSPPDFEVKVEAFDSEKQAPIRGVHVLIHPYRAFTDEKGVAQLRVAKGRYKLVVSGFKYIRHERLIDADRDLTLRAVLEIEPEPTYFD